MKIDAEIKLDFSDVLLVPKQSDLYSRQQVDLEVDFFDLNVVPMLRLMQFTLLVLLIAI